MIGVLPSAHRRPKFLLEELSRAVIAALSGVFIALFVIALILALSESFPGLWIEDTGYLTYSDNCGSGIAVRRSFHVKEDATATLTVPTTPTVLTTPNPTPPITDVPLPTEFAELYQDFLHNESCLPFSVSVADRSREAVVHLDFPGSKEKAEKAEKAEKTETTGTNTETRRIGITVPVDLTIEMDYSGTHRTAAHRRWLRCPVGAPSEVTCTMAVPLAHFIGNMQQDGSDWKADFKVWMTVPREYESSLVNKLLLPFSEWLKNPRYTLSYSNPKFASYEMGWRYFLLLCSVVAAFAFYYSLALSKLAYPWKAWALEQKWTFILAIFLILFNNPLLILSMRQHLQPLWIFCDSVFSITFLVVFLLAILAFTDHMSQVKKKSTRVFYWPKLLLLAPLWLAAVISRVVSLSRTASDPSNVEVENDASEMALRVIVGIVMTIYGLSVAFMLLSMSLRSGTAAPPVHVSMRFKVVWVMTFLMLVAIVVALVRSQYWGSDGREFLLGFVGFNLYVYMLCILFSPAKQAMPYRERALPAQQDQGQEAIVVNDEYEVEGDF